MVVFFNISGVGDCSSFFIAIPLDGGVLLLLLLLLLVGIVADGKKQLIFFEGFRVVYLGGGAWFILPEADAGFEFVLEIIEDEDDEDSEGFVVFPCNDSLFVVSGGNCVFCWLLLLLVLLELLELLFSVYVIRCDLCCC